MEKVSPPIPSMPHASDSCYGCCVVTLPAGSPLLVTLTDTCTSQPVTSILVVERPARSETGLLLWGVLAHKVVYSLALIFLYTVVSSTSSSYMYLPPKPPSEGIIHGHLQQEGSL